MEPLIRVEDLCHRFDSKLVLSQIGFELFQGECLALVGKGGAGKSLILKMICGLLRPSSGRVYVFDQEIAHASEASLFALRKQIGFVFQNNALFDALTVIENVKFPLIRAGLNDGEATRQALGCLAQVGLEQAASKWPDALSGGMKKRVCLARALVSKPKLLLCDDPTAGLDPVTTQRIFRLIGETQRQLSATVILVSHEISALRQLCERMLLIDGGQVLFDGSFEQGRLCSDDRVSGFLNRGMSACF